MNIKSVLSNARRRSGQTLEDTARKLGVTNSWLSRIENGKVKIDPQRYSKDDFRSAYKLKDDEVNFVFGEISTQEMIEKENENKNILPLIKAISQIETIKVVSFYQLDLLFRMQKELGHRISPQLIEQILKDS